VASLPVAYRWATFDTASVVRPDGDLAWVSCSVRACLSLPRRGHLAPEPTSAPSHFTRERARFFWKRGFLFFRPLFISSSPFHALDAAAVRCARLSRGGAQYDDDAFMLVMGRCTLVFLWVLSTWWFSKMVQGVLRRNAAPSESPPPPESADEAKAAKSLLRAGGRRGGAARKAD